MEGKDLDLYASNYIVHEYPTIREYAFMLILITAYSDSVSPRERECFPQHLVFEHHLTTRRPAL